MSVRATRFSPKHPQPWPEHGPQLKCQLLLLKPTLGSASADAHRRGKQIQRKGAGRRILPRKAGHESSLAQCSGGFLRRSHILGKECIQSCRELSSARLTASGTRFSRFSSVHAAHLCYSSADAGHSRCTGDGEDQAGLEIATSSVWQLQGNTTTMLL